MAAGLSMQEDRLEEFREKLNKNISNSIIMSCGLCGKFKFFAISLEKLMCI